MRIVTTKAAVAAAVVVVVHELVAAVVLEESCGDVVASNPVADVPKLPIAAVKRQSMTVVVAAGVVVADDYAANSLVADVNLGVVAETVAVVVTWVVLATRPIAAVDVTVEIQAVALADFEENSADATVATTAHPTADVDTTAFSTEAGVVAAPIPTLVNPAAAAKCKAVFLVARTAVVRALSLPTRPHRLRWPMTRVSSMPLQATR